MSRVIAAVEVRHGGRLRVLADRNRIDRFVALLAGHRDAVVAVDRRRVPGGGIR